MTSPQDLIQQTTAALGRQRKEHARRIGTLADRLLISLAQTEAFENRVKEMGNGVKMHGCIKNAYMCLFLHAHMPHA